MNSPPFLFGPGSGEVFAITQFSIIVIASILAALSISAYKNTKIKKLRYVIAAFLLFGFNATVNLVDAMFVDVVPDDLRFALVSCGLLAILVLLFVGIVKKENPALEKN